MHGTGEGRREQHSRQRERHIGRLRGEIYLLPSIVSRLTVGDDMLAQLSCQELNLGHPHPEALPAPGVCKGRG